MVRYMKRYRKRRGGKRMKKLTAASINRALMRDRESREEVLTKFVTTSANSDWPIMCIIPNNATDSKGRILFRPSYLTALAARATAAGDAIATLGNSSVGFTESNILRYYKNWVKCQVRNVALNPVEITIYDCIAKENVNFGLGLADLQSEVFSAWYNGMAAKMAAADIQDIVRTMAEGVYGAVPANDYGFLCKNINISPYDSELFMNYFEIRTHKIVLNPGESYIWRPRGFKAFDYDKQDTDFGQYDIWKGQTYFPILKCRGEIGLSALGVIGYTTVNLALHYKFGVRMYRRNLVASKAIVQTAVNAPATGTVILGPSEDVQVA